MDKFFEKIGIYDIWSFFYPGFLTVIISGLIYCFITGEIFEISEKYFVAQIVCVLFIGYYIGLILHELGNVLQNKIIFHHNNPMEDLLSKNNFFTEIESNEYKKMFNIILEKNGEESIHKSKYIFNYINNRLDLDEVSGKAVKLNVVYSLCRSLVAMHFVLFMVFIFSFIKMLPVIDRILLLKCFFVLFILVIGFCFTLRRCRRYLVNWVKKIIRLYYLKYYCINNETEEIS